MLLSPLSVIQARKDFTGTLCWMVSSSLTSFIRRLLSTALTLSESASSKAACSDSVAFPIVSVTMELLLG